MKRRKGDRGRRGNGYKEERGRKKEDVENVNEMPRSQRSACKFSVAVFLRNMPCFMNPKG